MTDARDGKGELLPDEKRMTGFSLRQPACVKILPQEEH